MLQLLSAPLRNGLRFFQHPLPAIPSAFLADAPAPTRRRDVGFAMLSSSDTNELAPAFHTGSLECPCVPCVQQNTRLRAFWPEPVSIFGSLGLTMLMAVHLYWAFHPACPSDRIDARSLGNHLTAFSASQGCQDFVPAASDKTVTSFAGAGRLLRTESQVRFMLFMSYQTITVTPSFHTHALLLVGTRILRPHIIPQLSAGFPRDSRWHCQRLSGGLSAEMSGQHPGNRREVAGQCPLDFHSHRLSTDLPRSCHCHG